MKLTVEKLLSLEAYKEAKIVGGNDGLGNEVSGITIMEDTTINEWLRGGETLLTSLLPLRDYQHDEIINFFNTLVSKKISAIIVKMGKVVNEIPSGLIEWGNNKSIPIIQVPRHVFYTDLMYPAMAEVIESKVNKLTYYKSVHEKFRDMAIRSCPMEMVIETLADIIGNPVEIYDRNYNLIMSTLESPIRSKLDDHLEKHQLGKDYICIQRNIGESDEKVCQLMIEISALENTKTYLAIIEKNKKVDDMDLLAIENACTNISLKMVKDIAVKEVEQRFMNDIINDLIFSSPKLNNSLLERANIAGIDLYSSYSVVVLNLKQDIDRIKINLKKQLAVLVKRYNGAYSLKSDSVIILVNRDNDVESKDFEEKVKKEIRTIGKNLQKEYSKICFSAGIGNVVEGFGNIKKSYEEARDAIDIGEDFYGQDSILSYDELGVFKLIRNISLSEDVSKYIPKSIVKLQEMDKSGNKELFRTLEFYMKNNRHIKLTADELFIHPKTVAYRLQQIRDITGIDFNNSDKLLEIQFAIKILKFLEKNN